jgi:HAD superfamily hydrolase (TIGR01509 family)
MNEEVYKIMPSSTRRNRFIILFLLFGINLPCFAQWCWPFYPHQATKSPRIENVIFDLGGVLLNTNQRRALSQLGIGRLLHYLITLNNPTKLHDLLYETLDRIIPLDHNGPQAFTPDGSQLLPQIMRNWLTGTMTCAQCSEQAEKYINAHPELHSGKAQKNMLQAIVHLTFNPEAIAKIQQPIAEGIAFVKKCKERGLNVYIVSNFDAESYNLIRQAHPELLGLFEEKNIFISGKLGLMKPDPDIFEIVLCTAELDPETCVFFDDQQENVTAARTCGINAFQCRSIHGKPDYATLKKQLDNLMTTHEQLAPQI